MVSIRMRSGTEATLNNGVWTSDDDSLQEFLEIMMVDHGPGPADGDPERACATRIASRLHADIIAHEPLEDKNVPGLVY